MLWWRTRRCGYSLVELLVVIAVITVIGITSIPNIFNRNDRLLLDTSASQLRQMIIEAHTRSQAPDKNDSSGAPQVFQLSFGKFATDATAGVANGTVTTNTIALERGLIQCDSGDLQGGFTTLRSYVLPRGVYISSFYPSNQTTDDDRAVIRFPVGDSTFSCGSSRNPIYKSGALYQANWRGTDMTGNSTIARYLVIALGSQKVGDTRYVTLDRVSRQVAISRSNPQSYFTPVVDNLVPKWENSPQNKFPDNFTMSVACRSPESDIVISFPRAKDRVNKPAEVDPYLFVAYNIYWKVGSVEQPLAIGYYYYLNQDTVRYQFSTDLFTIANQPRTITVTVAAVDAQGLTQPSTNPADDLNYILLKPQSKSFTLSCGSVISDPPPPPPLTQDDPPGTSVACNPIIPITKSRRSLTDRMAGVFVERTLAAALCVPEN